jgi:hypothetical protein
MYHKDVIKYIKKTYSKLGFDFDDQMEVDNSMRFIHTFNHNGDKIELFSFYQKNGIILVDTLPIEIPKDRVSYVNKLVNIINYQNTLSRYVINEDGDVSHLRLHGVVIISPDTKFLLKMIVENHIETYIRDFPLLVELMKPDTNPETFLDFI